jgi:hypothetical protein
VQVAIEQVAEYLCKRTSPFGQMHRVRVEARRRVGDAPEPGGFEFGLEPNARSSARSLSFFAVSMVALRFFLISGVIQVARGP